MTVDVRAFGLSTLIQDRLLQTGPENMSKNIGVPVIIGDTCSMHLDNEKATWVVKADFGHQIGLKKYNLLHPSFLKEIKFRDNILNFVHLVMILSLTGYRYHIDVSI